MLNELSDKIVGWAIQRNLINGSDPKSQFVKLMEEAGELASNIARGGNKLNVKDDLGDMFVVMTIIAAQYGLTMEECVAAAWEEIKDRKGRMVAGVFVKDAE